MYRVIDAWNVIGNGRYILTLNEDTPLEPYNNYRIGGEIYKPLPLTGSRRWIAVKGKGNFVGKEVEFVNA